MILKLIKSCILINLLVNFQRYEVNDRIEQLAKEALKELHTDKEGTLLLTPVFEKFAKLLINECADIADKNSILSYPDHGYKIKRHFGIE